MNNFEFISPTKIYFDNKVEEKIGAIIKNYGFKNVLFIYGKGSIKENGLYDRIINSLNSNDITFKEVSGVSANPKLSFINEIIKKYHNEKFDLILAVGGGSVIDSAKLLSHALYTNNDPFDYVLKKVISKKVIPVGVILTISAAGSELSSSCVITNDLVNPMIKIGFNDDLNRPLFTLLNPTLTYSVSKFQTGCGIVDSLMHTLERFMNPHDNCTLSENMAIGLLKTILKYGKIAINEPNNYEARAELMLASSLSHNGLTGLGKAMNLRVHGLEHVLSGFHDEIAHGLGLAALWPAWCIYVLDNEKANKQLTILAKELFNKKSAKEGIEELIKYFKEIGMETSLNKFNLKNPLNIEEMAMFYSNNKTKVVDDFKPLDYNAFVRIFNIAKEQ